MKGGLVIAVLVLIVASVAIIFISDGNSDEVNSDLIENRSSNLVGQEDSGIFTENNSAQKEAIVWSFDFETKDWSVKGIPPICSEPLIFPSPADVNLVSGLLYPGQVRGTDYKPHGGFRFDNLENNEVDVYAPINGSLFRAARHLESGEIQYSLYFINDCGIMYKLDHLRELTDKFEEIINVVPMGEEGDSRTTEINPTVFVAKGEHIATKVGIENYPSGYQGRNIFFDFGVYDLRKTNGVNYDLEFRAQHLSIDEYGAHALCWFDYLEPEDKIIVEGLPASGTEGEESDYCS